MKRLWLWAASVYLVLAATAASAQTPGVMADRIVIGAFGPISGPVAFLGLAGRDSAALAFKEINAAGGVNGRKIQMQFEDDAHSPVRALAAVKKLIEQDKVFMLMSVGGSNATGGTIGYVKERGTPMYVSVASAPEVTYPFARNLFRGATNETARFGEVYAEFLASHYKAKKIVLMTGRDEYSRNEGDATVAKLKVWFNIEPESRLEFNNGDKDFTSQLIAAQRANPDVIALFGNPPEAAIALKQARDLGLKQPIFVGSAIVDPGVIAASKGAAEGVKGFAAIPMLPGSKHPDMQMWEAAWRREYPNAPAGRPSVFDAMVYADAYVVAEGLRRAGPQPTPESFIRGLEGLQNYRVGPIATPRSFTAKHHIGNLTLSPVEVRGGSWEPVQWSSTQPTEILKRYE
ncbi:ABC transporter substrate-binding protein [Variovorax guangxiensis]|uniref:ABC transporter substrate-binding protein n=1 Tax=Variovorax guangxiensis TaxID=1775474 RepID=UPI0028600752|nr:ABC transporter substrate-binding protein [Variovorax guangxiensis]MDR6861218.1 branched-chain amino acid transport system substrate-binding protein [Variovorax guangxiensis]